MGRFVRLLCVSLVSTLSVLLVAGSVNLAFQPGRSITPNSTVGDSVGEARRDSGFGIRGKPALTPGPDVMDEQAADPVALILDRLSFRGIGPATMGGRVDDLAVLEKQPSVFYVGAATGGIWRTNNNGTTFEPVFDHEDVASIGAVEVAKDDPGLVWAGTGEDNNRQSSSWGAGVYKSIDGGKTWKNMGLVESRHIGRIVIDPASHDTVYVAATGHLWGPNRQRGVFKTTDGGRTWTQSLYVDEQTGATDLAMDPSNNQVLYAAMYQRQRSAWGFNGGGPGSGLYKTTDAGRTWTRLTEGIPSGPLGRIGIDIYRSNPDVVYALIEHESGSGLYRSDDAGAHWTKMSSTNPRPLYFSQVRVDPGDAHRVYVLGVRLMISDDEGRTFRQVHVVHTGAAGDRPRDDLDVHAMWIDPRDTSHLIIGDDVGIAASYDRGATWDFIDNLPIGQFYHVGYDMETPYNVYGGLQDNDVWGGPSAVRYRFGIVNRDWFTLSIGDGFAALADPQDGRVIYAETQDGNLARVNRENGDRRTIRPRVDRGEPPLRWAWDTPLIISPHDPDTLLIGANKVFKSTDRGDSWTAISPDLTSGVDRDGLTIMGVAGRDMKLGRNDGVSAYPTIVALAESPKKAGLYYAGADDGNVQVSRDGGTTWTNLTGRFPGLPERASAGHIVPSAFDEARAYATFDNHRSDDYAPYVYATSDYGATWNPLASTLPKDQTVRCLTEDPNNQDVLYLGTESGLFVTLDRGVHWVRLRNNLPTVPIDEITIQPRDNAMLLATHGRSVWILDDLAPIQHAAEAVRAAALLFPISPALEFAPTNQYANYPGDRRFYGKNPEFGARISYYLASGPKDILLTVRDGDGTVVRTMSSDDLKEARKAGLNFVSWDLRHQPAAPGAGQSGRGFGGGGRGGRTTAPLVLPGDYRVTLSIDGREAGTRPVRVVADPLAGMSDSDRRLQHDTALMLYELPGTIAEAASAIAAANEQVRATREVMDKTPNAPASATAATEALAKRLADLGEQFGQGSQPTGGGGRGGRGGGRGAEVPATPAARVRAQAATLQGEILAWSARPTDAQMQLARSTRAELASLVADVNDAVTNALPALYVTLSKSGVSVPPAQPIAPVKLPPFRE